MIFYRRGEYPPCDTKSLIEYLDKQIQECRILALEAKNEKNKVTEQQDKFLKALRRMGRCAVVCYEAEPAIQVISEYIRLPPGQHLSCDVLSEYPILK